VSPAPLLAGQAIALLTWAGVALWRGRLDGRRGWQFGGVLAIGYALVLGSYNFILLVSLVPAVAYAGGLAWVGRAVAAARAMGARDAGAARGGRRDFFRAHGGLVERFRLFQTYDFGWRIPVLTPEGWLGLVSGPELQPWRVLGLRWALAAVVMGDGRVGAGARGAAAPAAARGRRLP